MSEFVGKCHSRDPVTCFVRSNWDSGILYLHGIIWLGMHHSKLLLNHSASVLSGLTVETHIYLNSRLKAHGYKPYSGFYGLTNSEWITLILQSCTELRRILLVKSTWQLLGQVNFHIPQYRSTNVTKSRSWLRLSAPEERDHFEQQCPSRASSRPQNLLCRYSNEEAHDAASVSPNHRGTIYSKT